MSHFSFIPFDLTNDDIEEIRAIVKNIANNNKLQYINNTPITNEFEQTVFILTGVSGSSIVPMGFSLDNNELKLAVDLEQTHSKSVRKQRTNEIYNELKERMSELRRDKAIAEVNAQAEALRNKGTNVNVRVQG